MTAHSDSCVALWDGHGMAAEHPWWMGSSGSAASLPAGSAEQGSELGEPLAQEQGLAWPLVPCSAACSQPRHALLPTGCTVQQIWQQL